MSLVHLIYYSQSAQPTSENAAMDAIIAQSRMNNLRDNISGALVFKDGVFMQYLEGEREIVNNTYNRIVSDTRHTGATLLRYETCDTRLFAEWFMAHIPSYAQQTMQAYAKASSTKRFSPAHFTSDEALAFFTLLLENREKTQP